MHHDSAVRVRESLVQFRPWLGVRCHPVDPGGRIAPSRVSAASGKAPAPAAEDSRKNERVNTTSAPVYADRSTGQSFETARVMVDEYLRRFGERSRATIRPLDGAGHTELQRGSARVGVTVLEEHGVLLVVSKIMPVPERDREGFFRRLLELSMLRTSDAAFALEGDHVFVRALRRLSGLDYEELEDLVDTVATVADQYDDALRQELEAR